MSQYETQTEKADPIAAATNEELLTFAATLRALADIIEQDAYDDALADADVTDLLDAAHQRVEAQQ